jgi:enoyl-[acyl-carrier-protein] reductase (NADH)
MVDEKRVDMGELKANVSTIKEDMHDVKSSLASNFDKIEKVLLILATISEKQTYNIEEHKQIHKRIDDVQECNIKVNDKVEEKFESFKDKFNELHKEHIECIAMSKHDDTKTTTTTSNNSVWKRALDKVIEYGLIILICLVFYILAVNAPGFFKFVDNSPIEPSKIMNNHIPTK